MIAMGPVLFDYLPDTRINGPIIFYVVWAVLFILVAATWSALDDHFRIQAVDQTAHAWLATLREGVSHHSPPSERYAVYLRPFDSDLTVSVPYQRDSLSWFFRALPGGLGVFEPKLGLYIEEICPRALKFYSFGWREGEDSGGGGRVLVSDTDWQDSVAIAMRYAHSLFFLPGTTLGAQWELEQIVGNQWLSKTAILFPFLLTHDRKRLDRVRKVNLERRNSLESLLAPHSIELASGEEGFSIGFYHSGGHLALEMPLILDRSIAKEIILDWLSCDREDTTAVHNFGRKWGGTSTMVNSGLTRVSS